MSLVISGSHSTQKYYECLFYVFLMSLKNKNIKSEMLYVSHPVSCNTVSSWVGSDNQDWGKCMHSTESNEMIL